MYTEIPKYPMRLYVTPSGLSGGLDPPSADCPQPVHTDVRDNLRNELRKFTGNWMGQKPHGHHWHEGHPDIKVAVNDIIQRMIGITTRPKKLRCSVEMRRRAQQWSGELHSLLRRVKSGGSGYGGRTVVGSEFNWGFYRGPTYRIRSTSDPKVKAAMDAWKAGQPGKTLKEPVESDVPAGTVVATAGNVTGTHSPPVVQGTLSTAPDVTNRGGPRTTTPIFGAEGGELVAPAAGFGVAASLGIPESVLGLPTDYLLLGGGAYVAMKYLKKR